MKQFLIKIQDKLKNNHNNDASDLVHFFYFYFLVSFIVILSTALFFAFADETAYNARISSIVNLGVCFLVPLVWELLQKYWLGGSNDLKKMFRGWLFGFVPAIPFALLIPLKFI